ncbi:permease [Candidatus Sumerlaeota bacterium]|nr:permease [Candidatus Sumerlaeota bacterium]
MIESFFHEFTHYFREVVPYLLLGFCLSGIIHEFLPGTLVKKHLGAKGIRPILFSSLFGTFLPVCCIGSLPIAVSMYKKGARLGPVLAFLVTTPATSISALIVCYALLGWKFTLFIFFAVILLGLILGWIGNHIPWHRNGTPPLVCPYPGKTSKDPICGMNVDVCSGVHSRKWGRDYYFCSTHCLLKFEENPELYKDKGEYERSNRGKFLSVIRYAFWEMPREMGLEILIGLVLAAAIASIKPIGHFVGNHLDGTLGYVFSIPFGLIMYICSTASAPLVDALIQKGMNPGAGMALLMVGPVTSLSAILVLRKEFGYKILALYLGVICSFSLLMGILFSIIA